MGVPNGGVPNVGPKSGSQMGVFQIEVINRGPKLGSLIGVPNRGPKWGSQMGVSQMWVPNRDPKWGCSKSKS
jgi:hypothetical protein